MKGDLRADVTVALEWAGEGLVFEGGALSGPARDAVPGPTIRIDGSGKQGPSPVQLLAISLTGCMAADVVDILTKGRVPFEKLTVRFEAERVADPPRRLTKIRLGFYTEGLAEADESKLNRAIELSEEKYCSVLHSLQPDIEFTARVCR